MKSMKGVFVQTATHLDDSCSKEFYIILPLDCSIDVNIDVMAISDVRLESQHNENCYNKPNT